MDSEGSSFAGASLWIKDRDTDIVVFETRKYHDPTCILVSFDTAMLPGTFPRPRANPASALDPPSAPSLLPAQQDAGEDSEDDGVDAADYEVVLRVLRNEIRGGAAYGSFFDPSKLTVHPPAGRDFEGDL